MKVTHRVRFYHPGTFFAEDSSEPLRERSAGAAVAAAPKGAFAFVLYDAPVPDFKYDPLLFSVTPRPQNMSAKHYLGGRVFTSDELRALAVEEGDPDKYRTLISNVTNYVARLPVEGRAIRCRTGNWQPFEDGDVLVEVDR